MANETLGLKNVNLLTKEQYDGVAEPATDELWAVEVDSDNEFKETVVGWGMPDYTAGVSITLPYTATFKGVVHLVTANNTGRLKINNIEVGGSYVGGAYEGSFAAILDVGDVLSSSAAPIKATFFPLKGVN